MAIIEDTRTFFDMDLKATPVAADQLQIADSADGGRVKKIPISALPAKAGADATAIHVNVAAEIAGITAKAAPTILDLTVIEDAAAANAKKSIVLGAIMKAVGWIAALTAKASPIGADLIAIEDSAAAGAIKKATLSSLPIAAAQVVAVPVEVASDGAAAILNTTNMLYLAASTAGAKVIATTSRFAGQTVYVRLVAASGGSYTLCVQGGTLTLDAAGEGAIIVRNAADSAWLAVPLNGATIV
jgi:hypothetical protein